MHRRQPLPRLWLMTDERQGDALWPALEALPRGSGIVFRHYSLAPRERRQVFEKVRKMARRRGLVLMLAGSAQAASKWRADGFHSRVAPRLRHRLLQSAPAHNLPELMAARKAGADFVFLSPLFTTRSHPGARSLESLRFALLARQAGMPVIALGGVGPSNARKARSLGAYGWGAIDALTPKSDQKRKAVPT